jgi:hypothetical protein
MPRDRKTSARKVKAKIHLFCEGEKTEPNYIRAYIEAFHPSCARLKEVEKPVEIKNTRKNTPKQLVEVASMFVKELDFDQDQVWVMYDRESVSKYSDADHMTAWKQACKNKVKVALSNVCFEYWLLLHVKNTGLTANNCEDVQRHPHFQKMCDDFGVENYEKGKTQLLSYLMTSKRIQHAKTSAIRINQQTKSACTNPEDENLPFRLNPYTNVYEVLDAIDQVANPKSI